MALVKPTVGETNWGDKLNTALTYLDTSALGQDIIPITDNVVNLGSSSKRFHSIFIGPGTINITDQTLSTNAAVTVNNGVFNIGGITQAQLPTVNLTTLNFADSTSQTTAAKPLYNGSFEDFTTQTNGGATTANLVAIGSTSTSNGVSIVAGSKITFANAGNYMFNFLGQFIMNGAGSNYNLTVWYTKNNAAVNDAAYTFTTGSQSGSQVLANITDIISVAAGDYIQLYWWSQNTYMQLVSTASGSSPTRPRSASVNINVFNVG